MVVFEGQYPRDTKRGYRVSPESSGDAIEAKRTQPLSRVWSGCLGSAIEAIGPASLGVSHIGSVVSISVIFEDQGCLAFIQSFQLQSRHEKSLNLGQSQSRSFF